MLGVKSYLCLVCLGPSPEVDAAVGIRRVGLGVLGRVPVLRDVRGHTQRAASAASHRVLKPPVPIVRRGSSHRTGGADGRGKVAAYGAKKSNNCDTHWL